jgi:hypothetical protein
MQYLNSVYSDGTNGLKKNSVEVFYRILMEILTLKKVSFQLKNRFLGPEADFSGVRGEPTFHFSFEKVPLFC